MRKFLLTCELLFCFAPACLLWLMGAVIFLPFPFMAQTDDWSLEILLLLLLILCGGIGLTGMTILFRTVAIGSPRRANPKVTGMVLTGMISSSLAFLAAILTADIGVVLIATVLFGQPVGCAIHFLKLQETRERSLPHNVS